MRLKTTSEIGVPVVFPSNTPERISTGVVLFGAALHIWTDRLAPVEKLLDIRLTERKSRRTAVDDDARRPFREIPPRL